MCVETVKYRPSSHTLTYSSKCEGKIVDRKYTHIMHTLNRRDHSDYISHAGLELLLEGISTTLNFHPNVYNIANEL